VADNPDEIIRLKTFHSSIVQNHAAIKKEKEKFSPIPVVRKIESNMVNAVYQIIKQDVGIRAANRHFMGGIFEALTTLCGCLP